MTRPAADRHILEQYTADARRADPELHDALTEFRLPARQQSTWPAVYSVAVVVMLVIGLVGGSSATSVLVWILLVGPGALLAWWGPQLSRTSHDRDPDWRAHQR